MSGYSPAPGPARATAEVPVTADIAALVKAAGGAPDRARYEDGVLTISGVPQEALDAAMAAGVDPLHAARSASYAMADRRLAEETEKGMPWRGKVLQIHQESINDLTSMVLSASTGTLPPGFAWRMKDNTFLPVDAQELIDMGAAAMRHVYALLVRYWAIKAEVAAASDQAALDAIDTLSGWDAPPPPPGA